MHFNYDFNLVFYLGGLIYFLFLFISKRKAKPRRNLLIQRAPGKPSIPRWKIRRAVKKMKEKNCRLK